MVATEDPTSGSHLSEILASELPEVCCCWRRRSPAASHFTSRASSCQSQAAFRVWRRSDCDPSADRRISSLLWVRRTDTVLRGPRQPADRRELGRGFAALALGWEGPLARSRVTASEVSLSSASRKIRRHRVARADGYWKAAPKAGLQGWSAPAFTLTVPQPEPADRPEARRPLCVCLLIPRPRGQELRGAGRRCSPVDSLKENGNKADGK